MERSITETTNMKSWHDFNWELEPTNFSGFGGWTIMPLVVTGLVVLAEPPAAPAKFVSFEGPGYSLPGSDADLEAQENAEDLADGLATKKKYESEGVNGLIRYGEHAERRSRTE